MTAEPLDPAAIMAAGGHWCDDCQAEHAIDLASNARLVAENRRLTAALAAAQERLNRVEDSLHDDAICRYDGMWVRVDVLRAALVGNPEETP